MRRITVLLAALTVVTAIAVQQSLPKALADNAGKLQAAQALIAKVNVTDLTGVSEELTVEFSKPSMLKVESSSTLVVSDGKTISILDKAANVYSQEPVSSSAIVAGLDETHIMGWAWFFEKDSSKILKSASPGSPRNLRGVAVTEASCVLLDGRTTATLYVENKTGLARGFSLKNTEKTYVVWAEEIKLSDTALDAKGFEFVVPAGAKNTAEIADLDPRWPAMAQIFMTKCMPCHSGEERSGGLNLTAYADVRNATSLAGDDPERSRFYSMINSGRMPKGRPKLTDKELKTILAWLKGGRKP